VPETVLGATTGRAAGNQRTFWLGTGGLAAVAVSSPCCAQRRLVFTLGWWATSPGFLL
jgi:hypothetical protein